MSLSCYFFLWQESLSTYLDIIDEFTINIFYDGFVNYQWKKILNVNVRNIESEIQTWCTSSKKAKVSKDCPNSRPRSGNPLSHMLNHPPGGAPYQLAIRVWQPPTRTQTDPDETTMLCVHGPTDEDIYDSSNRSGPSPPSGHRLGGGVISGPPPPPTPH